MKLTEYIVAAGIVLGSNMAVAQTSERVTKTVDATLSQEDCKEVLRLIDEGHGADHNLQNLARLCNPRGLNRVNKGVRENTDEVNPEEVGTAEGTRSNQYPPTWHVEQEVMINGVPTPSSRLPPGVTANTIIIKR